MSTPIDRTDPVVQDSLIVATAGPPPRRLPDELILMVVDWCDKLVKGRLETLAALVRLAKRCKVEIERRLYSRVVLEDEHKAPYSSAGAILEVLIRRPSLRQFVRAVELVHVAPDDGQVDDRVAQVLGDLSAVDDLFCRYGTTEVSRIILSNPLVRLRRYRTWDHAADMVDVVHDYPAAFSTVDTLVLHAFVGLPLCRPDVFSGVTHLALTYAHAQQALVRFTSPFAARLTRLELDIEACLMMHDLSAYPSLRHLGLSCDEIDIDRFREAVPGAIAFVGAAANSACLVSLEWRCMVVPRYKFRATIMRPRGPLPEGTKAILSAIPRQIRHLSFLTNSFEVPDVAAYLVDDAQRPSQLTTLRIGGALGRGLGRILDGEVGDEVTGAEGSCGALAGVLERAGIEVTTVE